MRRLLAISLFACGPSRHAETIAIPAPSAEPAAHSIVVVSPPATVETAPTADTSPVAVLPPSDEPPFDRGAAAQGLGRASSMLLTCRQLGGPTGSGHVRVSFAPSGHVTRADVDAPFAGTPVGKCIEKAFEGVQVPLFSGAPVIVGKSFTIPP